jgi:hypothetical protein
VSPARTNTFRLHPLAPVVGIDIDGTLAAYYDHFRWFAELYLQEPVPEPDWSTGTPEFEEALGMDKATYRAVKLAYRQGGMKRSIPVIDSGVESLVKKIRQDGVQVWICTTRPWNRLDNIDPDTQFWINRHLGRVDGVIYGEEKYEDLLDIVGEHRIVGVVDDLPENVTRATDLGIPALMRSGPHNAVWRAQNPAMPVANSSKDIYETFSDWRTQK